MRYQSKEMHKKAGDSSYGDVDRSSFRDWRGIPLTNHDRRCWGIVLVPGIEVDDSNQNDATCGEVSKSGVVCL